MESNATEATTSSGPPTTSAEQTAEKPSNKSNSNAPATPAGDGSEQQQQRKPRPNKNTRKSKTTDSTAAAAGNSKQQQSNKTTSSATTAAAADLEDGQTAQAAGAEPNENDDRNKKQQRGRKGARQDSSNQNDQQAAPRKTRDFRNVFGDAIIEPEQIRDTVIEQAESTFCEADALHEKLQGRSQFSKLVRVHERVCEINDRFGVMDFSLKAKSRHSKDIDNAYFSARNDLSIWNNVRDGNTLLLEYNPDEDNRLQNVSFLRQGLPKFFTLTAEAVSEEKRTNLPRDNEQAYYQYDTLAQVRKALMEGAKVEVHRSLKTNGDGAHVTWSALLNAWVITSQNVSIVARHEKDIKTLYPEQTRYFLARKIALCWMRKVKAIEKNDAGRLEALKSDLADHVFIGDFIGNSELINLIKYSRETICFHSVMKKNRTTANAKNTTYCLPNSFSFLKRHPVDVTPNRICGVYDSYDELCTSLVEIHKQVANSSLSASEEGAVLTFIRRNQEGSPGPDSVISMCKVKSVEYQALKLLVDLLQGAVEGENLERAQDNLFTQFVKGFKSFSRNIDESLDSHPETFYIDLFSTAFTMIAKKSNKDKEMYQDLLYSDTVKFMVLVLKTNEEKNSGKRYVGQIDLESQNLSDSAPIAEDMMQPKAKKTATIKPASSTPGNILGEVLTQEPTKRTKQAQVAKPEATSAEDSKQRKGRGAKGGANVAPAKATAAAAQQEEKPKPARSSGSMPSVTALVVPPYQLSKTLMNNIKETYQVIESAQLNVSEIEEAMKQRKSKDQKFLAILSSLDGITEQSRQCNLKLFAYKCSEAYKGEPAQNFYLDAGSFYAHTSFKDVTSAKLVRNEVDKMIKVANSSNLIKLINPARMHLNTEEELMVVLNLQEPPSLNASFEEQKQEQETSEAISPVIAAKRQNTQQPASTKQIAKKQIKRQQTPSPATMQTFGSEDNQSPVETKKSQIVVVFPIGIPGMGKTHFAESTLQDVFEELNLDVTKNLHVIKNDLVRKACLDKYLKANPKKTQKEGVKVTATESIIMFKNQLNKTLMDLSQNKSDDLQMIYLDKNYPPAEIKITLEAINEHEANNNAIIRRVALVPHIMKNNDCPDFPFSMNFLVQCFIRCLEREDHLTIQNEDPDRLAKILVLFFQQFKGTQFNESFTQELGFDDLIKVRFTMEHEDLELPPKLNKALSKAVNSQTVQDVDKHIHEVVRLINLYRSLFGGQYSTPCTSENQKLLKSSLKNFSAEFKNKMIAAAKQAKAQQAQQKSSAQSAATPGAAPFKVNEAIVEESDDEDSFEQAPAAVKKQKTAPAKKPAAKKQVRVDDFEDEFEQQQTRSQKKNLTKAKTAVAPKFSEPAKPSFTPRANQSKNQAREEDEFEEVGATRQAKRRFSDSDSESDDERIPNTLLIKLSPNRQFLSQQIVDAMKMIPENALNSTLTDNISAINKLLTTKNLTQYGGWEHPTELNLICMHVGRDEDTFEESQMARDFQDDKRVLISCSAILLVPGKAIIGIASVDDQDVDEKVPYITLLLNDFRHQKQIANFVRNATQNRGPFVSQIQTLRTGGKITEKQRFKTGNVAMGRDTVPVTTHLITLDEPIEIPGITSIQY